MILIEVAEKSFIRLFGEYTALVLDIAAPPLVGGVAGYWLDERFGTRPWILVSGVGLGFIAAVINTIRLAQKLDRENGKNGKNTKD